MLRRISIFGASAAVVSCLTLVGTAQAATTDSGTVRNGGCDGNQRVVGVVAPTRIEAEVSSTSAANTAYADVLGPNGAVLASGTSVSYDTPGAGQYYVRVCTWYSHIDPPSLQYTATYATGPAGQPALPRYSGAVLAANATLARDVRGSGAIRTAKGLAFFSVHLKSNGAAVVRVYNPRTNMHYSFTNAGVHYLANGVSFTQGRMTMRLVQGSSTERIVYRSPSFKASGKVVRGSFLVV